MTVFKAFKVGVILSFKKNDFKLFLILQITKQTLKAVIHFKLKFFQ